MRLIVSKLLAAILIMFLINIVPTIDGRISAFAAALKYAPDEFIVKFKADANRMKIKNFNAANKVSLLATIEEISCQVLRVPPGKTVAEMVALYNQNVTVEWAQPNYLYHAATVPTDPYYDSNQKWYYDLILAEDAWDVELGDSDVIIAIVDSGVDLDHPDLADKIWINEAEYSGDAGVDDDGNSYVDDVYGWDFVGSDDGNDGNLDGDNNPDVFANDPAAGDGENQDGDSIPDDGVTHGTMVAGIAAAQTNNGIGVAGTAWNCKIMAVRALNPEGIGYSSDIASGIEYASESGANVINLSLGGDVSDLLINTMIDIAHSRGCVIVAAAGNNNTHPILYPAQYTKTIAVGASGHSNPYGRASFSNWGVGTSEDRLVDVVAPGVDISSTAVQPVTGNAIYSTGNGTSFSTPIVSGLAALVISRTGITNDAETIRGYINDGGLDLSGDPSIPEDEGREVWDGNGLVQFAHTDSLPVTLSTIAATTTKEGKISLRWTAETEVNNIGWNIYRSMDKAGSFTHIDFVHSAGNSALPSNYEYVDKNVISGITYFYYIEDVDIQGQKSKSTIVETTAKKAMKSEIIPAEFQVFQNYPNPFNPATWIPYQLTEDTEVIIRIYNVAGQLIRTLELGKQNAGFYLSKERAAYWNGKNDNDGHVAGGVYFYQIKIGKELTTIKKMVLLK